MFQNGTRRRRPGYRLRVHFLGKMMDAIKAGMEPNEAYKKNIGTYGRFG